MLIASGSLVRHGAAVDRAVGLYQYLGVEILICAHLRARPTTWCWAMPACPPSATAPSSASAPMAFGLGAVQPRAQPLGLPASRRWRRRRLGGRGGRRLHLAPARHLLRADDDRLRPGVLVHRHQGARHHRRRGRPAQDRRACRCDLGVATLSTRATTSRSTTSCWRCSSSSRCCCGGWCIRRSAAS